MKNLTTYNNSLPSIFDSFINNFLSDSFFENPFNTGNLSLDVEETNNSYIVKANLPGVKKEDVKVELKGKTLYIFAKHQEKTEESGKFYRRERFYGEYQRAIALPQETQTNNINAKLENGVLTLEILKAEPTKQVEIKIN